MAKIKRNWYNINIYCLRTLAKKPSNTNARNYFDKMTRSIQFNAAFVDIAHFITQHSDFASKSLQEFPSTITVTKGLPKTGPEAHVEALANFKKENKDTQVSDSKTETSKPAQ